MSEGQQAAPRGRARGRFRRSAIARSVQLRYSVTEREASDLELIGQAWGVPASIVSWVVLHDFLASCRRREPDYGEHGLAITAALSVRGLIPVSVRRGCGCACSCANRSRSDKLRANAATDEEVQSIVSDAEGGE